MRSIFRPPSLTVVVVVVCAIVSVEILAMSVAAFSLQKVAPGYSTYKRQFACRCQHTLLFADAKKDAEGIRQQNYEELMGATKLSLAPMMEYTDRHFRHLVRLVSSRTLLYTEMVAANSLTFERRRVQEDYRSLYPDASDKDVQDGYSDQFLRRYLGQGEVTPLEGPSMLQLGGSDPQTMFEAAQTVMDMTERGWCDYTAINLNCGCPSPKVAGKGCFGAALMDDAPLVSELTKALHDGSGGHLPVTVKCRIGTDSHQAFNKAAYEEMDPEKEYRRLCNFVETVASNGIVTDFSVHARIAVLQKSFSPADNRKIPPLRYNVVRRLVEDYPELTFSLNGGVESIPQALAEFEACPELKGVMIGRSFAADPWSFAMADRLLYNDPRAPKNRLDVLTEYVKHADREEELWDPTKIRRFITKAVTTLFTAEHNAKHYRIALDEIAGLPRKLAAQGKTMEGQPPISELILEAAHKHLSEEVLLRTPEESYERLQYGVKSRHLNVAGERSAAVKEWQTQRERETEEERATDASQTAASI
jgi:tRNA-dihydrouridine synthase A